MTNEIGMPIVDQPHGQRQRNAPKHDQRARHHFRLDGESVLPELIQTQPPALLTFSLFGCSETGTKNMSGGVA